MTDCMIGNTTADELRNLLGLELTTAQLVDLVREIEKSDPDRLGVGQREFERLLGGERDADEIVTLCERQRDRIAGEFKRDEAISSRSKRFVLRRLVLIALFASHRGDRKRRRVGRQ